MDGQQQEILHLLAKFEKGEASEQELEKLDIWYQSFNQDATYTQTLSQLQQRQAKAKLLNKINTRLNQELANQGLAFVGKKQFNLWPRIAVAALVIITLCIGGYFVKYKMGANPQVAQHDFAPGGNKAFLTLANGQKISLTDAVNGQVAKQAGIMVTKTAKGQLIYTVAGSGAAAVNPGYNTVETPKGGQYEVTLPDGTSVWLNASSSLKYSTSLAALKERRVQLTGEAYFEVAHNKTHPFIVQTSKQAVTVLGTHFNINAYNDEPAVKTTLLQGSVSVNAGQNQTIIKPGQQAVLTATNIAVVTADIDEVMAWKNGMFQFSDENLESIMRKVARWYNVDVEYTSNDVKAIPLTGIITHFSNASKVLRMLELTNQVHFKIEGRKIVVMPAKSNADTDK